MALSNAEKQARWRKRHADRRRQAAQVAALLLRRSRSDGRTIEAKVGWNTVTFDGYFANLAALISDLLATDKALNQLRWALAQRLADRKRRREHWRTFRQPWPWPDASGYKKP